MSGYIKAEAEERLTCYVYSRNEANTVVYTRAELICWIIQHLSKHKVERDIQKNITTKVAVNQSLDRRNNPFGIVQGVLKMKEIVDGRVNTLSYT